MNQVRNTRGGPRASWFALMASLTEVVERYMTDRDGETA